MTLYDRNMAFFARCHPEVHTVLSTLSAGETQLIRTAGGRPDVVRHGLPYGVEATEVVQLSPLPSLSRQGQAFVHTLCEHLALETLPLPQPICDGRAYHLVVIGVGLGLFLKNVLQQAQCHHLLLFEPTPERLYHSLHVLDWEDTLRVLPPRYCLTLLLGHDPSVGPNVLLQTIRDTNPLAIDGVVVLAPPNHPISLTMRDNAVFLAENRMYVDERIRSLRNNILNSRQTGPRLWRTAPAGSRPYPVMLVGSGPSCDRFMDDIRRLAPSCLVVAAGTALGVLLRNGIKPDLVVILGSGHVYYNDYTRCIAFDSEARHIPLLISESADPRFLDLATQVAFFGYPGNPLHPWQDSQAPGMIGPTITNTALALITESGYDDILLFGVDVGARDPQQHHAQDAPHMRGEIRFETMPLQVRGNLGGRVFTSAIFDNARRTFEYYLAGKQQDGSVPHVRNCGDGALIRGTHPTLARKLSLSDPPHSKADEIAALWRDFPPLDPQVLVQNWNVPLMLAELSALRQKIVDILDSSPEDSFYLAQDLWPIIQKDDTGSVILPLIQGLVMELMNYLMHTLNRLSPDTRAQALPHLVALLRDTLNDHCDTLVALLTDLDQGRTEGPWLIWDED